MVSVQISVTISVIKQPNETSQLLVRCKKDNFTLIIIRAGGSYAVGHGRHELRFMHVDVFSITLGQSGEFSQSNTSMRNTQLHEKLHKSKMSTYETDYRN